MSHRSAFLAGFLTGIVALVAAAAGWVLFSARGYRQHQRKETE